MNNPLPSGTAGSERRAVLIGILLMCLGTSLFPAGNAAAKFLVGRYPLIQIVWLRYVIQAVVMAGLMVPRVGFRATFIPKSPTVQLVRGLLLLISTFLYFGALEFISLPLASTINFLAPLIVTGLAVPVLGEKVGPRRWVAVVFGFIGAVVIIRPGLGATHWAAFMVLGATCGYAGYQLLTRKIAHIDRTEVSVMFPGLVGAVALAPFIPWVWTTPGNWLDMWLMIQVGLIISLGHFLIVKAFQGGPASVITPFGYVQLIGDTALGFLFFGDFPDFWTWVGATIIVGSGIYIVYREGFRQPSGPTKAG